MKCNAAGIQIIKTSEGCKLTAYRCPAGIWTIGFGHTGPEVHEGMTWTQAQADAAFAADVAKFEAEVTHAIRAPLTQNQFSALVSFAYNVRGWEASTLVRKINAGDLVDAADEFLRWNHVGGAVLAGLTKRRTEERTLFLS